VDGGTTTARVNRWFPPKEGALADHAVNDAHRRAFEAIYALQDRLEAAHGKLTAHDGEIARVGEQARGAHNVATATASQLNTKIGGIGVKGVPPKTGDTLRYNAATGQFEYGV
jgi:hypothetical protein